MHVRIGKWGRILQGQECGRYLYIQDDGESTGGFLILTKRDPDGSDGHDAWVETYNDVVRYCSESGWEVEWL
jgi:hypothetical protein